MILYQKINDISNVCSDHSNKYCILYLLVISQITNIKMTIFQAPKTTDPSVEERLEHVEQVSRTKVLRTCQELKMHGLDKNDFYLIDPDGELIGQPPILVYCDFQSGTTEVIHDSEELVKVDHCQELGCFRHDIQYGVPMSQIEALVQLSESCVQSIDYGCFLAPLADEGTPLGSWLDKNGMF
jgi:hypothetical protein